MRKGHPLSSEANGHPGPLRRWAARPPTLRGYLQGRNPDRPRPTLTVGAGEARCPLTGGLEKRGATSNLIRGDSVKKKSGTFCIDYTGSTIDRLISNYFYFWASTLLPLGMRFPWAFVINIISHIYDWSFFGSFRAPGYIQYRRLPRPTLTFYIYT